MLFLADESCDFAVVRALRDAEHEVVAVAEVTPRADDDAVLAMGGTSLRKSTTCIRSCGTGSDSAIIPRKTSWWPILSCHCCGHWVGHRSGSL